MKRSLSRCAACFAVFAAAFGPAPASAQTGEPFALLERLPSEQVNGRSEFAPLAAGPSHVVLVASNMDVMLFRKADGAAPAQLAQRVAARTFFADPPGALDRLTDPDVIFDYAAQRFFIAIADTSTARELLLAVSKSATPQTLTAADWYTFRLDRDEAPDIDIPDFDHLAIAGEKLVVSWHRTKDPPTGTIGAGMTVRIYDKQPLLAGRLPDNLPVNVVLPSTQSIRPRPARVSSAAEQSADRVFFDIWSYGGDRGRIFWRVAALENLSGSPQLVVRELESPFAWPENPVTLPQRGTSLPLRTTRVATRPVLRDGRLWLFEWFDGAQPGTTSVLHWLEVDVRGWPDDLRILQSGTHREPGAWLTSPGGILDPHGNLVLTFLRTGPDEFPSYRVTGRLPDDPPGTLRNSVPLQESIRPWERSEALIAVAGTAVDPVDGSVWISGVTPAPSRPFSSDFSLVSVGRLHPSDPVPRTAAAPVVVSQPTAHAPRVGDTLTLATSVLAQPAASFAWRRNGTTLANQAGPIVVLPGVGPADAGVYEFAATNPSGTTAGAPVLVGLETTAEVTGQARSAGVDIRHANGNIFDQLLLEGAAATFTADPGQITRLSFVDLQDDIVQIEFSGAGSVSVVLEDAATPAPPAKYFQPGVAYVKGHAGIVVAGADATTNLTIFSVGRANAGNPTLFRDEVVYDGMADLAFVAIVSADGQFGGLRTANVSYFATRGVTGVYAPGVRFGGPVFVGDIDASDTAIPMLVTGGVTDARITGGDLAQSNDRPVQVGGLSFLQFTNGSTSHGAEQDAQPVRARLVQAGEDVTSRLTTPPVAP